jgi:hypothetical protein
MRKIPGFGNKKTLKAPRRARAPERSLVDQAVALAKSGAPARVIAAAIGYSVPQYKRWLAIGQEEDAYETEHGAAREVPEERWLAVELYRGIAKAEAECAAKICARLLRAVNKGDMQSARWWLERRVPEFAPAATVAPVIPNTSAPVVHFFVPDDGRDPELTKGHA